MAALPREAQCAVQTASRLIDSPERPQDPGQPAAGNTSSVETQAGGKIVIPLVVIGREGLFEVRPRAHVIALEPARYAKDVHGPARRRQSWREPGVAQRSRRYLAHQCEVGVNKTDQPHAVIGRESRGGVFDSRGELARACKRSDRLWLAVPATVKQRMTVRGLQPQPEESLGRTIGQPLG